MIGVTDIQQIIANGFLEGNMTQAGLLMYAVLLTLIFAIISKYSMTAALVAVLPVTIVASMMGILDSNLMILILIVDILGLALYSKVSVSWDPLEGRDGWGRRKE